MTKKYIISILFITLVVFLIGCNDNNKQSNPHSIPLPYLNTLQLIGIDKKCQTDSGYLTIKAFDIIKVDDDNELLNYDNGYYVELELDTDLDKSKLDIPKIDSGNGIIELWISGDEKYRLYTYNYDELSNKLYCCFNVNNLVDEKILTLNISNNNSSTFPFFMINFGCFQYCVIDNVQYYNVNFYIPLEF